MSSEYALTPASELRVGDVILVRSISGEWFPHLPLRVVDISGDIVVLRRREGSFWEGRLNHFECHRLEAARQFEEC